MLYTARRELMGFVAQPLMSASFNFVHIRVPQLGLNIDEQ